MGCWNQGFQGAVSSDNAGSGPGGRSWPSLWGREDFLACPEHVKACEARRLAEQGAPRMMMVTRVGLKTMTEGPEALFMKRNV